MDYLSFVKAMESRSVVQALGDGKQKPLDDFYANQSWILPSYDFGRELYPDRCIKLEGAFKNWITKNILRLPFSECVFMHEFQDVYTVVRMFEQEDNSLILQPYSQLKRGGVLARLPYSMAFSGSFGRVQIIDNKIGSEIHLDIEPKARLDFTHTQMWTSALMTRTAYSLFALSISSHNKDYFHIENRQNGFISTSAQISSLHVQKNVEKFIPPTKLLRIILGEHDAKNLILSAPSSPKSPHERRAHERKYKNGKVVWVKAASVKGGSKSSDTKVIVSLR